MAEISFVEKYGFEPSLCIELDAETCSSQEYNNKST